MRYKRTINQALQKKALEGLIAVLYFWRYVDYDDHFEGANIV